MTGTRHLVVVGLMGAGKSTTAAAVAAQLSLPYRDSDADVEARAGRSGREIAASGGVEALHELEAEVLLDALHAAEPTVISAAGWTIEDGRSRESMAARADVVFLELDQHTLMERMTAGSHRRPMPEAEVAELIARRTPLLRAAAGLVLDARLPTADLVRQIVAWRLAR